MRASLALTLAVVTLILLSPLLPKIAIAQPSQGNWVITGTTVVQNKSITLNGILTVESGGNLTLKNDVLVVDTTYNGQYGISVLPGGSLYIYNSTVGPGTTSKRFTFLADGENFVMENTTLKGVGWCAQLSSGCYDSAKFNQYRDLGPDIQTSHAKIVGDTISDCSVGLILAGSDSAVSGNRIGPNDVGALAIAGSHNSVVGNVITHVGTNNTDIIHVENANETTIADNNYIQQSATWAMFNEIYFVHLVDSSDDIVANNAISSTVQAAGISPVFVHFGSNNLIANNTSTRTGGISLYTGANNRVEGNIIPVLYLDHNYNALVSNNSFRGIEGSYNDRYSHTDLERAVLGLAYSSDNRILDNVVESETNGSSVVLWSSSNNTIEGNYISNGSRGILLFYDSNRNNITDNHVAVATGHPESVLTIDSSRLNTVYSNDFVDNNAPAYDDGANSWDYGGVGNYWESYSGGGAPYQILPNGTDNRPLLNPVSVRSVGTPPNTPIPLPLNPSSPCPLAGCPPAWDVETNWTIENTASQITWHGIYVNSSLTISNSTLILGERGPVLIDVTSKGSLLINDSRILAADNGYGFDIRSEGGPVTIIGSVVHGAVYGDRGIGFDMGRSLVVEDSVITGSRCVCSEAKGSSGIPTTTFRVVNDTFVGNYEPILVDSVPDVLISGNTILDSLSLASYAAAVQATDNGQALIANNIISGSWGDDLAAYDNGQPGSRVVIMNNTIENAAGTGLLGLAGPQNVACENNFINNTLQTSATQDVQWDCSGVGNYWSDYAGKDSNLDGIGDVPYIGVYITDGNPVMRPSGWLTKFYLTLDTNLPPSTQFAINGTTFTIGNGGTSSSRLGYVANYVVSLPHSVSLPNGSSLVFAKWDDGLTTPTRTVQLSTNSTLSATYTLQAGTAVTTTTTSQSTTRSTSTQISSAHSSTSSTVSLQTSSTVSSTSTPTASTNGSTSTSSGGGIPEFPFQLLGASVVTSLVVASYLLSRRRRTL